MNEKARIAALRAGSAPSLNDWLEAASRPKLKAVLEELERTRRHRRKFWLPRDFADGSEGP